MSTSNDTDVYDEHDAQAHDDTFDQLLANSSLGTTAARRLRRRADATVTAGIWISANASDPTATSSSTDGELVVLHAHSYRDARRIGEHFRQGHRLAVDLTATEDEDAKRLVDFMAGIAFALHGRLERIGAHHTRQAAARIYLLLPAATPSR